MMPPARLRALGERTLVISGFESDPGEPGGEPASGEKQPEAEPSVVVNLSTPSGKPAGSFRYPGCEKLYQELRKRSGPRQLGVPPWVVTVDIGFLRQGKKVIRDLTRNCTEFEEGGGDAELKNEVLSLVGPWLTLSKTFSGSMGGGPPYHWHGWTTIDLRTLDKKTVPDRVYATEVLEEKSLLEALRADTYLRENRAELLKEAKSAREILEGLGETLAFAFHDFDESTGRVAVRIGFHEGICGMCPNGLTQLGLWAKPKPEVLPFLRAAKKGQGLLMKAGAIRLY